MRINLWGGVAEEHTYEIGTLQPYASADWDYRIAREYAELCNSRSGAGLIPESAPMMEDSADFWCQYHMGKPLREWFSQS